MVFYFFMWYSLAPPAAGRKRGEKEAGDTPRPPARAAPLATQPEKRRPKKLYL